MPVYVASASTIVLSSVIIVTVIRVCRSIATLLLQRGCTLKARRWAHSALHGRSALACTSLGHWQTHHVRGAFPFAGGSGLAGRSCAPVSFLAPVRRGGARCTR